MKNYDQIEVVEKNVDEIEVVEKFNPFHDNLGRFSNKHGFKSYSANPNTKAGAMAIARSAAAGHGNTANVHRESYGENIRQNANWIGRGKQQTPRQQGSGTLRYRVEPVAGLAGASAVGSSWQFQNQRQGRKTQQPKQPKQPQQPKQQAQAQQAQQAAQKPAAAKPNKPQANNQNPQQQAQQKPKQPNDRQMVEGRDLVAEMGKAKVGKMTVEQVLKEQGFDNKPKIAKTEAEFLKAVQDGKNIGVRSWNGADAKTRAAYDDQLKNGDFYVKCSGGNALGRGMYVAVSTASDGRNSFSGHTRGRIDYDSAYTESQPYGSWHVNMVIDKSAKLITASDAMRMAKKDGYHSGTWSARSNVDWDIGAYAAAKGYDGVIMNGWSGAGKSGTLADNPGLKGHYINMVNRSKVTIFDSSGDHGAGDLRKSTKMVKNGGYIQT